MCKKEALYVEWTLFMMLLGYQIYLIKKFLEVRDNQN